MRLFRDEKRGVWYVEADNMREERIAYLEGFAFHRYSRRLETSNDAIAVRLKHYAGSPEVESALVTIQREQERALRASRAASANINIPAPPGLQYMPFQRAGIAYALERDNVLIADEMGLGKTIQAIGICNALEKTERVLIVCPASLKLNWLREWKKWDVKALDIGVAQGKYWPAMSPNVVIINYDILGNHLEKIHGIEWDVLIYDEAHYLKNKTALRTKYALGGRRQVRGEWKTDKKIEAIRCIMLTGTPIQNRPREGFTLFNRLDPVTFRTWTEYSNRYCDASMGNADGASNLDELQLTLRSKFMIRRLKSEVLTELPAKLRQIIEIPATTAEQKGALKLEQAALNEQKGTLEKLEEEFRVAEASDDPEQYKQAVKALNQGRFNVFTEIATLRRETAESKIPSMVKYIKGLIEETDKLVVFAHHKSVIKALGDAFPDISVSITGDTPLDKRDRNVQAFQDMDSGIKLLFGNIQAAGVGLTLTASSRVLFVELDWVPGNLIQAEDRCHRIGQASNVLIQYLVLEDSLDAYIANRTVEKLEVIEAAVDKRSDEEPEQETPSAPAGIIQHEYSLEESDRILSAIRHLYADRKLNGSIREAREIIGNPTEENLERAWIIIQRNRESIPRHTLEALELI